MLILQNGFNKRNMHLQVSYEKEIIYVRFLVRFLVSLQLRCTEPQSVSGDKLRRRTKIYVFAFPRTTKLVLGI